MNVEYAEFLHCKFTVFFVNSRYLGAFANIPFLLQFSPAGFSTHWWILPTTVITVMFA